MKKLTVALILIAIITLGVITSCKKDKKDEPTPTPTNTAYSNPSDKITTAIVSNIPRIEFGVAKSPILKLYLSITDQNGDPLKNFNQYNFKVEQTITGQPTTQVANFTLSTIQQQGGNGNLGVGITMDYSGSMGSQDIIDMEKAVKSFIKLKRASDQLEIIKFDDMIYVAQKFTTDTTKLNKAVDSTYNLGGSTAFWDACDTSLIDASKLTGFIPAVIGFTDGNDNSSTITQSGLINKALQYQIPIYTVGFGSPDSTSMATIANSTGGRYYFTPTSAQIGDLFQTISGQLTNLYVLTWDLNTGSGKTVTIKITTSYTGGNGSFTSISEKTFVTQ